MSTILSKYIWWGLALVTALQQPLARAAEAEVCDPKTAVNPAPPVQKIPDRCDAGSWNDVANAVRQKVILMKIASSKADFKNISVYRQELDGILNLCAAADLHKVCDTECTVQRASAALFNVSELPYLDSRGVAMKVASDNIVKDAKDGIRIIDDALSFLATGNRGGQAEVEKTYSPSFNQFLQDNARLQSVKARLLMALGDTFYKNVSRTRATTLKKRAQNALQVAPISTTKPGEETDFAEIYYEQASWVIQEALVDIPLVNGDSATGSGHGQTMVADFGFLRREMESLQLDVEQRLGSVKKGFLFLNIDPETFTILTADDLQGLLQNQLREIDDLEKNIAQIVVAWQDKKTDEDRRQIDADTLRDERTLELKGMQIAGYEDFASQLTQQFQTLIAKNGYDTAMKSGKIELLEKQSMLANLRFELAKVEAEAKHQIEVINRQKELDVTILAREQHQEQRDQYKWLIDVELTTMNLNLQLNEYRTQIKDFEDQIAVKGRDRDSVKSQQSSKQSLIGVESNKIHEYQIMIDKLKEQSSSVLEAHLMPLKYQVCALAQEYAKYLGKKPDTGDVPCNVVTPELSDANYWAKVLAIRTEYFGSNGNGGLVKANYDKLRNCMGGEGNCDGVPGSVKDLVNKAYEAEQNSVNTVLAAQIKTMQDKLDEMINAINSTQNTVTGLKSALTIINGGFGAVYVGLAGKILGLPPEFDVGEQAKAVYDMAMSTAEHGIDAFQTSAQYEMDMENLRLQKLAFVKELETAKANLKKEEIAKNRAMAEIVGKGLELEKENLMVRADASGAILDANRAQDQLKAEGPHIQAEINDVLAQMKALTADNNLLTYELRTYDAQIAGSRQQIDALDFEIDSLESNIKGIDQDIVRLDRLRKNAVAQQDLVASTQTKVGSLNNQVSFQTSLINDLYSQQEKSLTALTKEQIDQIQAVFKLNETQIQTSIGYVQQTIQENIEQLGLIEEGSKLTSSMNDQLQKVFAQVKAKRCEMLQFASSRPTPGAQENSLFLASEDVIANLTQGVPEYIRAKKNRLDYVNYLYNLYRSRVTLLSDIIGSDIDQSYSYIQNGQSLEDVMKGLCSKSSAVNSGSWVCSPSSILFNNKQVPVLAHTFTIPSDSGFMSRLLSKGEARFEITPAALQGVDPFDTNGAAATMANKGYFQLWDGSMSSIHNMSVVNLALMAEMDPVKCSNKVTLNLRHLGYGARYFPVSTQVDGGSYPVLSVTAPRYAPTPVWSTSQSSIFDHYFKGLVNNYAIVNFPEDIQSHSAAVTDKQALQFLGAPLVGTYEISIDAKDPWVTQCLLGASLNIGIAFTKPAINQ